MPRTQAKRRRRSESGVHPTFAVDRPVTGPGRSESHTGLTAGGRSVCQSGRCPRLTHRRHSHGGTGSRSDSRSDHKPIRAVLATSSAYSYSPYPPRSAHRHSGDTTITSLPLLRRGSHPACRPGPCPRSARSGRAFLPVHRDPLIETIVG